MIGRQAGSAHDPRRTGKLERRIAELERQLLE
jgi:hypothetical protein